ncbi:hypothetical protein [Actinophytocola sp.]|uniref:hypothetical protein n=1 Tax=Actinophytocola sp. TaxID=1872138 RepID=UPI002ED5B4CC
MPAARRIVRIVFLVQVACALPLGLVLGILLDPAFLYGFGGAALVELAVLLGFMLVWQRTDARRDALLATGRRTPALLVSTRPTRTHINERVVLAHTFESREAGRVIRAETKAFAHLPLGTEATIAYDRAAPENAVVVEDLDRIEADGRLDWAALKQRENDRRFRNRS